jgi:hypothetical protein
MYFKVVLKVLQGPSRYFKVVAQGPSRSFKVIQGTSN